MSDKFDVSYYENPTDAVVDGELNTTHPEFEGPVNYEQSRKLRGLPPGDTEPSDIDLQAILSIPTNFKVPNPEAKPVNSNQDTLSRLYKLLKLLKNRPTE